MGEDGRGWKILGKAGKGWERTENDGKIMRNYGRGWERLGKAGKSWKRLEKAEKGCERMGNFGKDQQSPENPRKHTRAHPDPRRKDAPEPSSGDSTLRPGRLAGWPKLREELPTLELTRDPPEKGEDEVEVEAAS